ncbi:MAG: prepilin-type N-terminal cleavage/methylation domain-containing protein [Candidatus Omnitrophica bacterium]|nr:prepilin-type N-terminal cleavage/methylation domain-containing protein [Candidatus Omnitrophota bacterium]MBU4302915.1 prepilin-type N-terminal cleavage/methylation domain-containing protein [Candidatus Omnitrophota bacterium]MBU4418658.1 prepilin-type N-terminal cleavage/methylation domain-containing protein [Candidatus Omnitrophota bacterium]MBU4468321.1 prepilin-type N-terminal cleavage/methylation domain-containing protein [Candidatus Omnitrophota bacterium]MCG2707203.1 prepilin-type N-
MKLTRRGFSLIETMFSVSILLIVIISALLAITNVMFLNESNRNMVTASNDAQYVMEQIKTQSFSNISTYVGGYSSGEFTNLPQENVSFPNPVYTANLDTITVQISWRERNAARTFSITTCFAQ